MSIKKTRFFDILSISDGDSSIIIPYREINNLEFDPYPGREKGMIIINGSNWLATKEDFNAILEKYKTWCSDCSQVEFELNQLTIKTQELETLISILRKETETFQRIARPISELADKFSSITSTGEQP